MFHHVCDGATPTRPAVDLDALLDWIQSQEERRRRDDDARGDRRPGPTTGRSLGHRRSIRLTRGCSGDCLPAMPEDYRRHVRRSDRRDLRRPLPGVASRGHRGRRLVPEGARRGRTGARARHRHRTGRDPLAEAGVEVHGIDTSQAMVDQLRVKPGGDRIHVDQPSRTSPSRPASRSCTSCSTPSSLC